MEEEKGKVFRILYFFIDNSLKERILWCRVFFPLFLLLLRLYPFPQFQKVLTLFMNTKRRITIEFGSIR